MQRELTRPSGLKCAPFLLALALTLYCALRARPVPLPIHEDVQHAAAFATLTLCGSLPWMANARARWRLALGLVGLGALIEALQALPIVHRDADLLDWLADDAGVAAAVSILWTLNRLRQRRTRSPMSSRHEATVLGHEPAPGGY